MAIHPVRLLKNMDRRKTSGLGLIGLILLLVIVFVLRTNKVPVKFLPGDIEAIYRSFETLETNVGNGSFEGLNGFFDDGGYSKKVIASTEAPNTTEPTTNTQQSTPQPITIEGATQPTNIKTTTKPTTAGRTPPPRPQSRVGEQLILTPFLESGNDAYARQRANVNLTEFPTVRSYAGYFTVNSKYNSNLFFWYFPATKVRSADAPVVLFLEGMLGMSALASLFLKNGPLEMGPNGRPRQRWDSLNSKHNMIYLDSPVGAGYSYIKDVRVFPMPKQISAEVYEAMRQFFEMFPDLRKNKFFVTGESLAGQFIPLVAWRIHERNERVPASKRINLQGIAIGNGWVDPKNQLLWARNLYRLGLIDKKEKKDLHKMEKKAQECINNEHNREATSVIEQLVWNRDSLFNNLTGYHEVFNFLNVGAESITLSFVKWITSENVRLALHVGANRFEPISRNVQTRLRYDMTRSVAPISSVLLDHYRVLIYTGELDMFCPYLSVQNWLGKLEWSGAMQFSKARKVKWLERGNLVGYTRRYGRLIEVLVRNAGHFSFIDQPQWTRVLLEHFTNDEVF